MLTEAEIIAKLDEQINAGRDEPMFVETEFKVDFDAETILSYDEDEDQWLVNRFAVRSDDDSVDIEPVPMMSFPGYSL